MARRKALMPRQARSGTGKPRSTSARWRLGAIPRSTTSTSRGRARRQQRSRRGRGAVAGLRQLHAGRRADRAGTRDVRRRGLRPPPSAQAALRPGQCPAPQPEHPSRPVVGATRDQALPRSPHRGGGIPSSRVGPSRPRACAREGVVGVRDARVRRRLRGRRSRWLAACLSTRYAAAISRLMIHACLPTCRPRVNPYCSNSSTVALNRNRS